MNLQINFLPAIISMLFGPFIVSSIVYFAAASLIKPMPSKATLSALVAVTWIGSACIFLIFQAQGGWDFLTH